MKQLVIHNFSDCKKTARHYRKIIRNDKKVRNKLSGFKLIKTNLNVFKLYLTELTELVDVK